MDPQRIESNSHLYEEILSELQQQNTIRTNKQPHIVSNRKDYARLDISSMGVDLKEHFRYFFYTFLVSICIREKKHMLKCLLRNYSTPEKESLLDAQSPSELKRKTDQPEKDDSNTKNDVKSSMANIKHISGTLNSDDLYALPNKNRDNTAKVSEIASDEEDRDEHYDCKSNVDSIEEKDSNKDLPCGWEKHEDNDGPYYWHIKSGTIQREPPLWPKNPQDVKELKTPIAQAPSFITQITNKNSNASLQQLHNTQNEIVAANNRTQVEIHRQTAQLSQLNQLKFDSIVPATKRETRCIGNA